MEYIGFEKETYQLMRNLYLAINDLSKSKGSVNVNLGHIEMLTDAITDLTQEVKSISNLIHQMETERRKEQIDDIISNKDPNIYVRIEDIADQFETITYNSLLRHGFRVLKDLTLCTKRQISKIRNIGNKSMTNIEEILHRYGLDFAPDTIRITDYPRQDDYVVLMVDEFDDNAAILRKGTMLRIIDDITITDIYPHNYFSIPRIKCKTDLDRTIYVSLGEIKKI